MILSPYSGVINAFVTLVGQKPGSTAYAEHKAYIDAHGQAAYIAALDAGFAGVSNASLGATILANMGLTSVFTQAQAEAYLASASNRVQAVLDLAANLSNYTGTEAGILAAKTSFVATVSNAYAYASVPGNTVNAAVSADALNAGSNFTLTTAVDGVTGSAGDDTITGLINSSGTYTVGDNIIGGAGTDTLNLIAQSATDAAGGLVSVAGVENVNVRLLSTAAAALTINASDWSGVAVLSNASSIAGTLLQVTALDTSTKVNLVGDTDINVGYNSTTTATEAVTIALTDAGNFGATGAHTLAGTGLATANIDLDLANAGLVTSVNVEISGAANAARLEAGSNVATYTLSGNGSAVLVTDDTITSFNASAMSNGVDITFQGASDVAAVGGAGNDIFRFGTTYSNNDSVNGGDGVDTIALTMAGFNRNLNASNVESATITFSEAAGGTLNASGSTINSYTFAAGTAGNAASLSQIADASTITLNADNLGDVTLDYASGAASTVLNVGSASGTVGLGTLAITDVANVTINSVGVSGSVGGTIGTASFDTDLKNLSISTSGGEADLTIGTTNADMSLGGATALTITSNGSAGITFNNVDLAGGSALTTVTVNANNSDAADITVGDVSGSAITSINLNAASGADIIVGTVDIGDSASAATVDETITIVQGQTSNVTMGAITVSGQGTLSLNITQNGTAVADIGTITLVKTGTADAAAQNLTVNALTVAASGEVAINGIDLAAAGTGAQLGFGTITVSQDGGFSAGVISGTAVNVDISDITLVVGASGSANFAGFLALSAGAVGARDITVAAAGSANFGAMTASALGTTTISLATSAAVDFGAIITDAAVGAIEIGGEDGADVTYNAIGATSVGAIAVSGALDVTFGTITAVSVGEVNNTQQGASGNFTIDLSGVTNAIEMNLGAATNSIIGGAGNDVITLLGGRTAAAGNDTINYNATGQGTDNILNFIAGAAASGGDVIALSTAMPSATLFDVDGSAIANATTVDLSVAMTATGDTLVATDNIIVIATALSTTAGMLDFLDGVTMTTAAIASATFVVAWGDGSDTYVTLVDAIGGGSAGAVTLASGGHTLSASTLAVLQGVTPGALVAANFDFIT